MARLRDTNRQIPGGYRFRQPETGFDSTKVMAPMPSLRALAQALIAHRKSNPHLLKLHGWKTNTEEVVLELEEYNAKICLDNGWRDFVALNLGESALPKATPPLRQSSLADGVAAVRVGAKTIAHWLGDGGKPVAKEEAERRAAICAVCPKNEKGDWTRFFTQPASDLIRKQLGMAKELKLTTSRDPQLNVCGACLCPLKLKVWVPLPYILEHTDEETKAKLDPSCWITK